MPTDFEFARFFLIFLRVSAFISFAPPFGGKDVPAMARAGFSLLAAVLLQAWVPSASVFPTDGLGWALAAGTELLIGLALAGFWALFLGGIQMSGHLIGAQMGFGWGGLFDPTVGDSSEVIVLIQRLTLLLLFFVVDGHLRLMEILVRSLQWVPLGQASIKGPFFAAWSASFSALFEIGFKLAAPLTVAIWLMTLALGLIGRAAPAMNLLSLDFPLRTGLGFLVLAASAPHLMRLSERLLDIFFRRADLFVRCLAP
ncbi:MAG: flagellar biosynthetic protein FliR [Elusimicrobia bacterium]|nr:flagellar biosynthetic protein FliR [Elusimicrobiota bacterium]